MIRIGRVALLVVALLPLRSFGQEITSTTQMEQQILDWTNEERAKVNAPPLKWNNRLALAARLHSDEMAGRKELSHQLKGEPPFTQRLSERGAKFSGAAENVGYADSAEELQSGWMHSPGHRANLLNPVYTEMGVGIVRAGNRLWATTDFATGLQNLSPDDFEQAVEQQLASRRSNRRLAALKATRSSQLRRVACSGESSASAAFAALPHRDSQASAFNFTTPSPTDLPSNLMNKVLELPSGSYLIGACPTKADGNGMSTYRVVVILYR
jgi:Cysteine-rich secretory protein family